jgi:hypothetical protein
VRAAIAIVIVAAATPAAADCEILIDREPDPPRESHDSLLGMRMSIGTFPLAERDLIQSAIGLTFEHRIHGGWRLAGDVEYLWLEHDDEVSGSGMRAQLAIRRALARSRIIGDFVRFYLDAEVGGGLMLATEPEAGTLITPGAFAGIRMGYDFISKRPRASRVWEPEILVRGFRIADGIGVIFGVGFGWSGS